MNNHLRIYLLIPILALSSIVAQTTPAPAGNLIWTATTGKLVEGECQPYTPEIANTPPLRGVMSPKQFKAEDFPVLQEWGVNLVRFQLARNWGKAGTDQELSEYDQWLKGMLDHLEWAMAQGHPFGIRFIIDLHSPPGGRRPDNEFAMMHEARFADHFVEVWKRIATRFRGNPALWGYDLVNEPCQYGPVPFDYFELQRRAAEAVRAIDPVTPVIIESNIWAGPDNFSYLPVLPLLNVIYQCHMYQPGGYTHQLVKNTFGEKGLANLVAYPGVIGGKRWDKEQLRKALQNVRDFQLKYHARIYVGEFSAIGWAPGAAQYLQDCIELFEEYHWDWTYHAFREWNGWSVEHDPIDRTHWKPSADNPRKRALLNGLKLNRQ